MNQAVTGGTEQLHIPQIVASAFVARNNMVDLQKPGVMAARCFTFMAGIGKSLSPDGRWDGGFVALAWFRNLVIAFYLLEFLLPDFQFPFAGLDFG